MNVNDTAIGAEGKGGGSPWGGLHRSGRPPIRAFTPVFVGLWDAPTNVAASNKTKEPQPELVFGPRLLARCSVATIGASRYQILKEASNVGWVELIRAFTA